MRRAAALPAAAREVLEILGRVDFATLEQLTHWHRCQRPAVTKAVARMATLGLVDVLRTARPHILGPTGRGRRAGGLPESSGHGVRSFAARAHCCHRNAAEIRLATHFPGFRFARREALYPLGLNPCHGEHWGRGEDGVWTLVLLDDYLMPPTRIPRAWARRHRPRAGYADPVPRYPGDFAERLVVIATDAAQAARHRRYLERADVRGAFRTSAGAPVVPALLHLPALWGTL